MASSLLKSESINGGNITPVDALGLLFIGLKLTDNIDWSWVWVLSPIWIPFVLGFFIGVVTEINEERKLSRRRRATRF